MNTFGMMKNWRFDMILLQTGEEDSGLSQYYESPESPSPVCIFDTSLLKENLVNLQLIRNSYLKYILVFRNINCHVNCLNAFIWFNSRDSRLL